MSIARTKTMPAALTIALVFALSTVILPFGEDHAAAKGRKRGGSPRAQVLARIADLRSHECLSGLNDHEDLSRIARRISRGARKGHVRSNKINRLVGGLSGDHAVVVVAARRPGKLMRALMARKAFHSSVFDRQWDDVGVGTARGMGRVVVAVIFGTALLPSESLPGSFIVPDSIPADCSRPVENEIMAWLRTVPDGATARFQHNGCYGQDETIELEDRVDLTIDGNGASFKALTRGSPNRDNWRIEGGRNITLKNMTVCGSNPHAGIDDLAWDTTVEWQHGFRFAGTQGGTLENVRVFDVYGDFVEAMWDWRAPDWSSAPMARSIVVRNSHFERNGRMGFGLTGVDGFLLENSYVGHVNMAAVDLELDIDTHTGRNIRILNNVFGPHRFSLFSNGGAGTGSQVGDVIVSGNRETASPVTCMSPVYVENRPGPQRTNYVFTNNRFRTLNAGFDLKGVQEVLISENVIRFETWGGCARLAGVRLSESRDVTVVNNAFQYGEEVVERDSSSTGIVAKENTLSP
jgi:hypothetical protein